jgi:hypothetical protein
MLLDDFPEEGKEEDSFLSLIGTAAFRANWRPVVSDRMDSDVVGDMATNQLKGRLSLLTEV